MTPAPDPAAVDAEASQAMLDRAAVLLATHTARDGRCGGCLDAWERWAPYPCEQRRWAVAVLERYGADAQVPPPHP